MDSPRDVESTRPPKLPRLRLDWLAFGGLTLLILASGLAGLRAYNNLKAQTEVQNIAAHQVQADIGASFIADHQMRLVERLTSIATRASFMAAVSEADQPRIRLELRALQGRNDVSRVFFADSRGRELYTSAPARRSFEGQDWLNAVVQSKRPHVSTVRAEDGEPVVVIAAPVMGTDQDYLGAVGVFQRVAFWKRNFARLSDLSGQTFYLFDQNGQLLVGPTEVPGSLAGLRELARGLVSSDRAGLKVVGRMVADPASGDPAYLTAARVPPMDWLFVIAHDYARAMAPTVAISDNLLLLMALLFVSMLMMGFFIYSRYRLQRQALQRVAGEARRLDALVRERTRDLNESAERVRELSRRLFDAQEEERKRVALDLHDELGPLLGALKMKIQELDADPRRGGGRGGAAVQMVQRLIDQVRHISYALRPAILDNFGLRAALADLAEAVSADNAVRVEARLGEFDESRLTPGARMTVFRFVQEGLTNAVRHSGQAEMEVEVAATPEGLRAAVRDRGRGFDAEATLARALAEKHLGLLGMRERIDLIGGRLDIASGPAGTSLTALIPWEN